MRLRSICARLSATVTLLVVLVAPPAVIASLIGRPWPHWHRLVDEVSTSQLSDDTVMRGAAAAFVLLWLWAVVVIVAEVWQVVGDRAARLRPTSTGPSALLRRLVRIAILGSLSVVVGTTTLTVPVAARSAWPLDVASSSGHVSASVAAGSFHAGARDPMPDATVVGTPSATSTTSTTSARPPGPADATGRTVVASGRDTPYSLALRLFGDEGRRDEIAAMNAGDGYHGVGPFPPGMQVRVPTSDPASSSARPYEVVEGDSIFAIAARFAGPSPGNVAALAAAIVDANLGREMPGGKHFTEPSHIEPGWVLEIPVPAATTSGGDVEIPGHDSSALAATTTHVVEPGESLWSIADDDLGSGVRWREIYEANRGREFPDGRQLDDPDQIMPGWSLELPPPPVDGLPTEIAATEPVDVDVDADADADVDADADADVDGTLAPVLDVVEAAGWPAPPTPPAVADAAEPRAEIEVGAAAEAPAPADRDVTAPAPSRVNIALDANAPAPVDDHDPGSPARFVTIERAAMLAAGALTVLAVRRRERMRRARPRARIPEREATVEATERRLLAVESGQRFARVDIALRAAAIALIEHQRRPLALFVAPDGEVELRADGDLELPAPWDGVGDRWYVPAETPIEVLAEQARRVAAPSPLLIQLGVDSVGRDVYVDLEALELLEVVSEPAASDAVIAAIAATLAGSVLAEVATLVGAGVTSDAFLGHRRYIPARSADEALLDAIDVVGTTASMARPTFELRARATSGEAWEPAAIILGSTVGVVNPPANRKALAIVSAAPIVGATTRLRQHGAWWTLEPWGIEMRPVGLAPEDVSSLADLVTLAPLDDVDDVEVGIEVDAELVDASAVGESADSAGMGETWGAAPEPDWDLVVRLLGPVGVEDRTGVAATFDRSKTRELVAWLVTHRDRATRTGARTALWEHDVRDNTFSNVVSEARRSLARLMAPPDGAEWIGRTMTESLPLHPRVVSDADLVADALRVARTQAPPDAVATLSRASAWVAGMPFEGTSYLWPDAEGITSHLVLLAMSVTSELAAHRLRLGDVEGVFEATGRGLQVLPGHEELIGLRMRAHAHAGDLSGVREEWAIYERGVTCDPWSDGEPSAKLVELRHELLNFAP